MSTIHVCDRCKAATTKPTMVVLMDIRTVQSEHPGELCEGCLAKLRDWLRGETPSPTEPARDPDLGWTADGVRHTPRSPGWRE